MNESFYEKQEYILKCKTKMLLNYLENCECFYCRNNNIQIIKKFYVGVKNPHKPRFLIKCLICERETPMDTVFNPDSNLKNIEPMDRLQKFINEYDFLCDVCGDKEKVNIMYIKPNYKTLIAEISYNCVACHKNHIKEIDFSAYEDDKEWNEQ